MKQIWIATLAVVMVQPLVAGSLDLCVSNPARLDSSTLQVFRNELSRVLASSARPATFTDCHPGVVSITLRAEPVEGEGSALGATRRRNGHLVGEIEIFVDPTAQLLRTRLPAPLGRALARVATPELGHWLGQVSEHSSQGIMMERLSAAHLMAPDRGTLRLPVRP